jgi:drug/metabolite transporter (DMT)-like permease
MEYWIFLSIISFFLVGLWNINLINIKNYSGNHLLTWFRIMFVITGFLSLLSFLIYKPDIKISEIKWTPLIYSAVLLFAYQLILLYTFSSNASAFPLVIVNLNIILVMLYQIIILNKPISIDLLILMFFYIILGSIIIYKKQQNFYKN